jgi:type VI secretion system protein ImpK
MNRNDRDSARENLAYLYEGLFTAIVRLQSGQQSVGNIEVFERRIKRTFEQISRHANEIGYSSSAEEDARFAVVAFLDEAILTSTDPARAEWERNPLQDKLFHETNAGVKFFEKLDKTLAKPESPEVADVLEVYALCLQLGFEGTYSSSSRRQELAPIITHVTRRIGRIRKVKDPVSPDAFPPQVDKPAVQAPNPLIEKLRLAALAAVALSIAIFAAGKAHLLVKTSIVESGLSSLQQ